MFDLTGKKALVTGATQGIGFAAAKALAEHGAEVFVNGASSMEKCIRAAEKIPGSTPVLCDLFKDGCAEEMYHATGDVDLLILNASVQFRNAWETLPAEQFDAQVRVNFKSNFELMQKYVPAMKQKRFGRIITVGSVQQHKPHVQMPIYAATKCAQMSLVENLALQLAPFGITVNNLSPGVIATPRNEAALADPEYSKQVYSKIPAGFAGTPEDCAAAFLLLASNEGRYITGIDLSVDGGMHL